MTDNTIDIDTEEVISPCHGKVVYLALADGVLVGSCGECDAIVCRINPRTGVAEWLDGASPWTEKALRPMTDRD